MTEEEKQIVNRFYFGQITKEEFLEQFPVDLNNEERYIYLSLKDSFDKKSKDDLELVLTLVVFSKRVVYTDEFVELLCLLLKAHWHQQHENIVMMLQNIK